MSVTELSLFILYQFLKRLLRCHFLAEAQHHAVGSDPLSQPKRHLMVKVARQALSLLGDLCFQPNRQTIPVDQTRISPTISRHIDANQTMNPFML
jgi:hypothetical protein